MEAFSLLKYWRGGGGGGAAANAVRNPTSTTITSSVPQPAEEHDDEDDEEEEEDEGSFFDLEFTVPDDTDDRDEDDEEGSIETDEDRDFDFTVSSAGSDGCRTDPNLALSPSDDLFFKGKLVQLEPSSIVYNSSEPNSRTQFPVSLLKSATKFRVFLLGFKKPKAPAEAVGGTPAQKQPSRFFTVKFKVEEVPIVSLFTRDNSSRSSNAKSQKQQPPQPAAEEEAAGDATSADAKRFAKVVMQKYLKMIKPLYVKVSRRYGEKLRFSGQLSLGLGKASTAVVMQEAAAAEAADSGDAKAEAIVPATEAPATVAPPANAKQQKQGNLPSGLRVVCKHLGKSRSASAAIVAAPQLSAQRRDDSLLQQQDGIQSAIAHCKRSFNASKDSLEEISLPRSSSDSRGGKSLDGCLGNSIKG